MSGGHEGADAEDRRALGPGLGRVPRRHLGELREVADLLSVAG